MKTSTKLMAKTALIAGLCVPITLLANGDMMHMNTQSIGQKGGVAVNLIGDWRVSLIEIDGAFPSVCQSKQRVCLCRLVAIK